MTAPAAAGALSVASWTLFSRITGLVRVAVAGATLGPTFFANIFQATNTVPSIAYNLLAGSLLTTLIVPVLVEAFERDGIARARATAQGLLGMVIAGFCGAGIVVLALGPAIVHLLTIGVPAGPQRDAARTQTWVLLLLVVPQMLLYGVAAVAIAAQNAQHRFRLAAAAPAVENVGLIVCLLFAAGMVGSSGAAGSVSTAYLLVLGGGATLSVAAHAGLQLLGAARAGLPLRPRWGWRDPTVRAVARHGGSAVGTATLDAGAFLAVLVAAGTVPGGVVAVQIGFSFFSLPLALSARAVGTVSLPTMARHAVRGRVDRFAEAYGSALAATWYLAVPASLALVLMAGPIARALAFGRLERGNGIDIVAVALAALAPALLGGSTYEIAKQACYARGQTLAPLAASAAQVSVTLVGAVGAVLLFDGAATLAAVGATLSLATLLQALLVDRSVRRSLTDTVLSRWPALVRTCLVSAVTITPAVAVGRLIAGGDGTRAATLAGIACTCIAGLLGYVAFQAAVRAPEPAYFRRSLQAEAAPVAAGVIL